MSFKWKDSSRFGPQGEVGFIAQEVQEVVPELVAVNGDADETLSVHYPQLTAVLTSALQTALDRIETLEARLDSAGL